MVRSNHGTLQLCLGRGLDRLPNFTEDAMSENEIDHIAEAQLEVQEILEDYGIPKDQIEDAAARIVNILIDALDAVQEEPEVA